MHVLVHGRVPGHSGGLAPTWGAGGALSALAGR